MRVVRSGRFLAVFLFMLIVTGDPVPAVAATDTHPVVSTAYSYDVSALVYDGPLNTAPRRPGVNELSVGQRRLLLTELIGVSGRTCDSPGCRDATKGADDFVNLASDARTSHILDGEVRPNGTFGGGHRGGTGYSGKSEFPTSWSDDQIMHHISDITTDPALTWRPGNRLGDFWVNGTRGGVDIEVLIRNGEIWTAYPTNLGINP